MRGPCPCPWWLANLARRLPGLLLWGALLVPAATQAHLMVAQRGTVNLVGDGAFVVVSLPVSAFDGVDDDGDGRLGAAELQAHQGQIAARIQQQLQLLDDAGPRPLQGLLLSLAPLHEGRADVAAHIVAMGRFALADPGNPHRLRLGLAGTQAGEQTFHINATRGTQTQLMVFDAAHPEQALLPSGAAVLANYVVLGIEHILTGFDHLLFLLVVLAAGLGWRQVVAVLTCFTLGHGVTLAVCLLGGLQFSPAWVEPAIAATIVVVAGFDWQARRRASPPRPKLRLALVTGCALIHGLGLASSLAELGLGGTHRLLGLAGFNLGIELGQLAVALAAAALLAALKQLRAVPAHPWPLPVASVTAMTVGSAWLVQRVIG